MVSQKKTCISQSECSSTPEATQCNVHCLPCEITPTVLMFQISPFALKVLATTLILPSQFVIQLICKCSSHDNCSPLRRDTLLGLFPCWVFIFTTLQISEGFKSDNYKCISCITDTDCSQSHWLLIVFMVPVLNVEVVLQTVSLQLVKDDGDLDPLKIHFDK